MAIGKLTTQDNSDPKAVGPQIFFKPLPTHIDAMVLGVATAETYAVPAEAKWILLSADADFYARSTGAAAVPSTEITDGTGSELNPVGYVVEGGESLSLIAPAATVITIAVYDKY